MSRNYTERCALMLSDNDDIEVKRTCPDCKGHCVEDIYDPDSPPCRTCYGEGEI